MRKDFSYSTFLYIEELSSATMPLYNIREFTKGAEPPFYIAWSMNRNKIAKNPINQSIIKTSAIPSSILSHSIRQHPDMKIDVNTGANT